jgi:hypothetical protein
MSFRSWGTCVKKTTVVTPGQWGFPTKAPAWPELAGAKVRPVEARVTPQIRETC